ncbi:MAG TPA: hypothetical protein VLI04_10455 [Nocardioidaceae bacterium]|nr:hypothetical protein [Nocardioidaceae bacterium]
MRNTLVSAAALLLTLSACGGDEKTDELTADEQQAATSISAYWQGTGMNEEPSDCLGEKTVRSFGLAHLKDLGALNDELDAETKLPTAFTSATDATTAATNTVDCLTLSGLMMEQYKGVDEATAECLAEAYGRDRYIKAMADTMQGLSVEEAPADVTAEMSKCVPQQ